MFKSFMRWLRDFPRPSWVVRTDEAQFFAGSAERAREIDAAEAEHGGGETTWRLEWLRPSEVGALPEM